MTLDFLAPTLLALAALVTAVLTYFTSRGVERRAAKKDEVQLLREEISRLQIRVDELMSDNDGWRKRYDELYTYVLVLRKALVDNRIDVPDMVIFADRGESPIDATTHPKHKR